MIGAAANNTCKIKIGFGLFRCQIRLQIPRREPRSIFLSEEQSNQKISSPFRINNHGADLGLHECTNKLELIGVDISTEGHLAIIGSLDELKIHLSTRFDEEVRC